MAGSEIVLIGPRKDELGGGVYYHLFGELGANIPQPNPAHVKKEIELVLQCIEQGLALACHDISDGGLGIAIAEMCLGSNGDGEVGARINLTHTAFKDKKSHRQKTLRSDVKLFSETGGFVLEVTPRNLKKLRRLAYQVGVPVIHIGRTMRSKQLTMIDEKKEILDLKLSNMRTAWTNGLRDKM
ncbi:MAG: phosphoribosylformylglycinamidine synthase II [Candidatus Peregrinibacteria bacterium GW2011_GWA2_47_7]|nr:MAG: phosphoribosylformylglycinamidine synthase II [Candidatus Peregrinibacteria bacterium GW2011_GWA2_47_7]